MKNIVISKAMLGFILHFKCDFQPESGGSVLIVPALKIILAMLIPVVFFLLVSIYYGFRNENPLTISLWRRRSRAWIEITACICFWPNVLYGYMLLPLVCAVPFRELVQCRRSLAFLVRHGNGRVCPLWKAAAVPDSLLGVLFLRGVLQGYVP